MVQDRPAQGHTQVPGAVLSLFSGLLSSITAFTFVRGWAVNSEQLSRIPWDFQECPVLPSTGEACMPWGSRRFPAHTLPGTAGLKSKYFSPFLFFIQPVLFTLSSVSPRFFLSILLGSVILCPCCI